MLTADDFAALLNTSLRPDGADHSLTLIAVERGHSDGGREPFTLILRGPRAPMLAEGQYAFDLPDHGRVSLYVIPVHTPAPTHMDYQIVFN